MPDSKKPRQGGRALVLFYLIVGAAGVFYLLAGFPLPEPNLLTLFLALVLFVLVLVPLARSQVKTEAAARLQAEAERAARQRTQEETKRAAQRQAQEETEATARRQAAANEEARDEQRREQCQKVLDQFFAQRFTHLADERTLREKADRLVADGVGASSLADALAAGIRQLPGVRLGTTSIKVQADDNPLSDDTRPLDLPVVLPDWLRSRHLYIVGKSGSGKTTLLRNLIMQDLAAGNGLAVIAPEQEMLTEEILPFIPDHRMDDVVYINPADTARPIPFNPLHLDGGKDDDEGTLDLRVDETLTAFRRIFDDAGAGAAPRMETIMQHALYTLTEIPGRTLLDIPKLLDRHDPSFRQWAVERVSHEDVRHFWTSTYPVYPKDAHLAVINRLSRFLRPRVVRNLLCPPGASFDLGAAMDSGKILLFNLSDGVLGESNAQLIGQLIIAKLQMAAMARARMLKTERRPFFLYIDEFQSFCGVAATSYEKILSRARKYGLGLILAHQQTGQIPETLMREILGNVSSVVSFVVSATDARRIGREMVCETQVDYGTELRPLPPQELLSLPVGETYCKIDRGVFRMSTPPPPTGGSTAVRDEVIRRSRERYGVPHDSPALPGRPPVDNKRQPLDDLDPDKVF